jgi:hypothetical protein
MKIPLSSYPKTKLPTRCSTCNPTAETQQKPPIMSSICVPLASRVGRQAAHSSGQRQGPPQHTLNCTLQDASKALLVFLQTYITIPSAQEYCLFYHPTVTADGGTKRQLLLTFLYQKKQQKQS